MAELTLAEYESDAMFDADRYAVMTEGALVLKDPATGNPYSVDGVEPQAPPAWIANDHRFQSFMGGVEVDHEVTAILGEHSSSGYLAVPDGSASFEDLLAKSDVLCYESFGWFPGEAERIAVERASGKTFDSLIERRAEALRQTGKPSFSSDIERSDVPLDRLLLDLTNIGTEEESERTKGLSMSERDVLAMAGRYMREWYKPAKYVHETENLADVIGRTPTVLDVNGAGHEVSISRLPLQQQPTILRPEIKMAPAQYAHVQRVMDMNRTGRWAL